MNTNERAESGRATQPEKSPEQLESEAYQVESDAAALRAQAEGMLISAQNKRRAAMELRRKMIQESPEQNARFEAVFGDQNPEQSSSRLNFGFNPKPRLA